MLPISTNPAGQTGSGPVRLFRDRKLLAGLLICIQLTLVHVDRAPALAQANESPAAARAAGLPELCGEVEQMKLIVELIRRHMGAEVAEPVGIVVENVSLQDLYFQIRTLLARTDRLFFEIIRLNSQMPPLEAEAGGPQEMLKLLQAARASLVRIMQELVPGNSVPPARIDHGKSAGGLFTDIQRLNKQLDLLLDRPYTPADIYAELTLSVGYAARLLSAYPNAEPIPPEPAREEDRLLPDVYLRLLQCFDLVASVNRSAGMDVPRVEASGLHAETISLSEIFDMAVAIVARLDALHKHFGLPQPPPAYFPGRRYPADLYQRAGLLMAQLQQLTNLSQSQRPPQAKKRGQAP